LLADGYCALTAKLRPENGKWGKECKKCRDLGRKMPNFTKNPKIAHQALLRSELFSVSFDLACSYDAQNAPLALMIAPISATTAGSEEFSLNQVNMLIAISNVEVRGCALLRSPA
jgi:hypothetical protein